MAKIHVDGTQLKPKRKEPEAGEVWTREAATQQFFMLIIEVERTNLEPSGVVCYFNVGNQEVSRMNMAQFLTSFKFASNDIVLVLG